MNNTTKTAPAIATDAVGAYIVCPTCGTQIYGSSEKYIKLGYADHQRLQHIFGSQRS